MQGKTSNLRNVSTSFSEKDFELLIKSCAVVRLNKTNFIRTVVMREVLKILGEEHGAI
jgi:hypothetical protein